MQCPLCRMEAAIRLLPAPRADGVRVQEFCCRCRSCENYGRVIARREISVKEG